MDPILIVSKSKSCIEELQKISAPHEIMYQAADTSLIALELLNERKYSICILDIDSDNNAEKKFIKILNMQYTDMILLVMADIDSNGSINEIMQTGCFNFIIKPIVKEQYSTVLSQSMEFRRLKDLEINYQRNIHKELLNVREIQVSLLPKFDDMANFDTAFSILPVDNISGDFVDGFFISDDIYQIILCDVSGHGITSAYIGFEIRSIFRTLSLTYQSPDQLITRANMQMTEDLSHTYFFATVLVCQFNIRNGNVCFSSGGHPPPFLFNAKKREISHVNAKGALIGFDMKTDFECIDFEMAADDTLLLYTDGITESLSEDRTTMYDNKRLEEAFMEAVDTSSVDIVHSVLDSLYTFTNYSKQEDDITILCLKKL